MLAGHLAVRRDVAERGAGAPQAAASTAAVPKASWPDIRDEQVGPCAASGAARRVWRRRRGRGSGPRAPAPPPGARSGVPLQGPRPTTTSCTPGGSVGHRLGQAVGRRPCCVFEPPDGRSPSATSPAAVGGGGPDGRGGSSTHSGSPVRLADAGKSRSSSDASRGRNATRRGRPRRRAGHPGGGRPRAWHAGDEAVAGPVVVRGEDDRGVRRPASAARPLRASSLCTWTSVGVGANASSPARSSRGEIDIAVVRQAGNTRTAQAVACLFGGPCAHAAAGRQHPDVDPQGRQLPGQRTACATRRRPASGGNPGVTRVTRSGLMETPAAREDLVGDGRVPVRLSDGDRSREQ